jgi:hypothetical protein
MQDSEFGISIPYVDLEQAITDIVESVALEENALSGILRSEGELLQKAGRLSGNVDEYVLLNDSVRDLMNSVVRLQTLLQFKLEEAKELFRITGLSDIDDDPEE